MVGFISLEGSLAQATTVRTKATMAIQKVDHCALVRLSRRTYRIPWLMLIENPLRDDDAVSRAFKVPQMSLRGF
jgi:hypothetical protein